MASKTLRERFDRKFEKRGPDECWPWTGAREKSGYGRIHVSSYRSPGWAHRVSYELAVGVIPEGMEVCHTCDNPSCVNPAHLFVGTTKDNALDKVAKGRNFNPSDFRTHCKSGHPLVQGPRQRYCPLCKAEWTRQKRAATAERRPWLTN